MAKPVLAVDIDEVLAYFIPKLSLFHNEKFGTNLLTEHFTTYEFHHIFGGTQADCNVKMDMFFESEHITLLEPIPGAFEVLSILKQDFSLHVVTARQHKLEGLTRTWVETHFPDIFDAMHFGNHYSTVGKSRSKSQMCLDIGARLLIDDSVAYAKDCSAAGIRVILFGDYPWNQESSYVTHSHNCPITAQAQQSVQLSNNPMIRREHDWTAVARSVYEMLDMAVPGPLVALDQLAAAAAAAAANDVIINDSLSAGSTKPVLAVDIDEVLAYFIPKLSMFHNELYGTSLLTEHFTTYEFHHIFGGTPAESSAKINMFFESEHITLLEPVAGAFEVLSALKQDFALHVVTARQLRYEALTRSWVEQHFPDVFEAMHFGNHYTSVGKSRSKSQMCLDIGARLLIDDSVAYAKDCSAAGIRVILFGDYPWNQESSYVTHSHNCAVTAQAQQSVQLSNNPMIRREHDWTAVARSVYEMLDMAVPGHCALHQCVSADSADNNNTNKCSGNDVNSGDEVVVIACVQMNSSDDMAANMLSITRLVTTAVTDRHATLVCLPECAVLMGSPAVSVLQHCERVCHDDVHSPYVTALCALAAQLHIWLSVGGFPEKRPDLTETKISNTHFIISPDGVIQPTYRKIHLFDNPLVSANESAYTGLTICYDLRFPNMFAELCRPTTTTKNEENSGTLGGTGGAEIVLVPAAFSCVTGAAHWAPLLRARAIENQVYVVAAAQVGLHSGSGRQSYGHSMIVDPWGTVLAECERDVEDICYATFDRAFLMKTRQNMPIWDHWRPSSYHR